MFIKKLWRGEYSLPITYWVFGVLGNIFLGPPLNFIDPIASPVLFYSLLSLITVYSVIVAVGIWRSATKYHGLLLWKYLAKIVAVISLVSVLATSVILIPAIGGVSVRTDYQLVSECEYDQLLNSKPNLELQVWTASADYCQRIVLDNLKNLTGNQGLNLVDEQKKGLSTIQVIDSLLMQLVEQKKFKPIDKYLSISQCKLDQLSRIKNTTNPNLYAAAANHYCDQYVAINLGMKAGYDLKGALAAGYSYKEIAEYLEVNPFKK